MKFTASALCLSASILWAALVDSSDAEPPTVSAGLAQCRQGHRILNETQAIAKTSSETRQGCVVACQSTTGCSVISFVDSFCTVYRSSSVPPTIVQDHKAHYCKIEAFQQKKPITDIPEDGSPEEDPISATLITKAPSSTSESTTFTTETATPLIYKSASISTQTTLATTSIDTAATQFTTKPEEEAAATTPPQPPATTSSTATDTTIENPKTTDRSTPQPGAVDRVPLSDYFFFHPRITTWDAGKTKCDTQNNGIFAMACIDSETRYNATYVKIRTQTGTDCYYFDLIKKAGSSQWNWNRVKTLQVGDFNKFYDQSWLTRVYEDTVVACVAPQYNFTWLTNASDEFAGMTKYASLCQAMDPNYKPRNSG